MNVKVRRMLAFLGVLAAGALLLTGCGREEVATKHFETEGISFDYPATWSELFDPFSIAYFGESGTDTAVKVFLRVLPSGLTLKVYHDDLVLGLMVGEPISGRSLGVAGAVGYETVFNTRVDEREVRMRLVSFAVEDAVFDIYFTAAPASFNNAQRDFDIIINTFEVN